jgi:hypothetical protein
MTHRGIAALKRIVKKYQDIDGASRLGAFRDTVTDLMHLALDDKELNKQHRKGQAFLDWVNGTLYDMILSEGHNMFLTEKEDEEREKIEVIPKRMLLLYKTTDFNFETSKLYFENRLKGKEK